MKPRAGEERAPPPVPAPPPADSTEARLFPEVRRLNDDPAIHGILVQQPLPPQISTMRAVSSVATGKDVDCFHPENVGLVLLGTPRFAPATPAGGGELPRRSGDDPGGQHVVILGPSHIVGEPPPAPPRPQAEGANATVTGCHSGARDRP